MAPAGVVEMIPLKCWRPVCEYFLQPATVDIWSDEVPRYIGQPDAIKSGMDRWSYVAQGELPLDTDAGFATVLLEFPGIEPA